MNLTYAIADLHGADDLLTLALSAIDRHASTLSAGTRKVVFLGDYVDRGAGSRQILETLMAGPSNGWRWICLRGNHEDMMVSALNGTGDVGLWLDNGGNATLRSYEAEQTDEETWSIEPLPAEMVAWVEKLPFFFADAHRVFVHAGVDPSVALDKQYKHEMMWSRRSNSKGHEGRFVVHGHVPNEDGPVVDGRSINLDTFAWRTGRLVVGIFKDECQEGPIDLLWVERPSVKDLSLMVL